MTHFVRFAMISAIVAGASICAIAQDDDSLDALLEGLVDETVLDEAAPEAEEAVEEIADTPAEEVAAEAEAVAEADESDALPEEEVAEEDVAEVPAEEPAPEAEDVADAAEPAETEVEAVADAEEATDEVQKRTRLKLLQKKWQKKMLLTFLPKNLHLKLKTLQKTLLSRPKRKWKLSQMQRKQPMR